MAKKFIINNASLEIYDTVLAKNLYVLPLNSIWYKEDQLQNGAIVLFNIRGFQVHEKPTDPFNLTECVNSKDEVFTQSTFRIFAEENFSSIQTKDYYSEIQQGRIPGHKIVHKFGAIKSVGATMTPVTSSGNFPTPNVLTDLEIVSDNTNDTFLGTGARTIRLSATSNVNGSWTEQTIDIELNGTTAVQLPNGVFRVYRMKVLTSGTYASQASPSHNSTITLRETGAGSIWHEVETENSFGLAQSEIAVYTVPKDYTGYLISKKISVEGNKSANVYLFTREGADIVTAPFSTMNVKELERNLTGTSAVKPFSPILVLPGATDVGFMASADVGTTSVSVDFEILLIKNQ